LLSILLTSACAVGPVYNRPYVDAPRSFRFQISQAEAHSFADLPWWSVFSDPALQELTAEALANNHNLQVAFARVEQARALVGVARSQLYPEVNYDTSVSRQSTLVPGISTDTQTFNLFQGLVDAAWEIDVWGRVRRTVYSARARLFAEEEVRRAVILTLVSDVAAGYFRLLELDRQLAIAQESARTYKSTLDMFRYRFEAGRDSELPVRRAQGVYEASLARIEDVRREIAQQENALSVLVGANPRAIERGRPLTAQFLPLTPPGATTAVLQRRPDIQAAEQRMIAANEEVAIAVTNYFPRIGLSALAGAVGVDVSGGPSDLFGVWSIALGATGPIFNGGRLNSIYNQRRAFWDETVAQYRQTVLVAFQETSDALIAQQTLARSRTAFESQVAALERSLEIALLRFDSGRAGYFEVLEAEQQLFPAKEALARTQRDQLVAVVNLYRALGGGWQTPQAQAVAQPPFDPPQTTERGSQEP
jgi:multidrug efflux system outer membrane protein